MSINSQSNKSWQSASDPKAIDSQILTHGFEDPFSAFCFPPKKDASPVNDHGQCHPDKLALSLKTPEKPLNKPYRSMSTPGVFPLKRRQSGSPLRKISYSENLIKEPGAPAVMGSPPTSTSPLHRTSLDNFPPRTPTNPRRTSVPGSFTLKHIRQPSPLSMGGRSSSASISSSTSNCYSDIAESIYSASDVIGPPQGPSPGPRVPRATSMDGSYFENSDEWLSWRATHPSLNRSGSFTLRHHSRPSPLGSQAPMAGPSVGNPSSHLQTIYDDSSPHDPKWSRAHAECTVRACDEEAFTFTFFTFFFFFNIWFHWYEWIDNLTGFRTSHAPLQKGILFT